MRTATTFTVLAAATADDRLERAGLALLAVSLAIDAGKHADTYPSDRPYAG